MVSPELPPGIFAGLEEAVQGNAVACGIVPGSGRRAWLAFAGQKRRFMAGKMKRPAIDGGGQKYWNDGCGSRVPCPIFQRSSIPLFHSPGWEAWWEAVVTTLPLNRLFSLFQAWVGQAGTGDRRQLRARASPGNGPYSQYPRESAKSG
jgi:hypothetical protein